ncbi:hypothetical protein L596_022049 [Steinernema carpocapsae]|uniref:Serpin domain-containing protein n=1 Tax=Steinernema carpocapsae TaxID=34508 RepID=A0A4U5MKN2_STECR|nr:hypothetical protein L596_022049 [Steinernema carpocapsae]
MKTAFDEGADLSRMATDKPMFIDTFTQNVFVNEKGTEAAAFTKVGPYVGGNLPDFEQRSFIADHPFFYFIVHEPSLTVLFGGVYC